MSPQPSISFLLTDTRHLEIRQGDITAAQVDAIVNAANARLAHGGGVAGAIARKGGPTIQQESDAWVRHHGAVTHARPAWTTAGQLQCRYVIHAVGPVWGSGAEESKLNNAVLGSLALADELRLRSIAFPAISTGIFGFPVDLAARIFMAAFSVYFRDHPNSTLAAIQMVLFDETTLLNFQSAAQEHFGGSQP